MKKHNIIAVVLTVITLFVLTDFDFFNTLVWMPNVLWTLPLYLFFMMSVLYFKMAFKPLKTITYRILLILGSIAISIGLLSVGFHVWKINSGNIFMDEIQDFQINVKNIWFWCIYQSYLLLFFFSAFKQLVTIK
ncbi:hypothetical protein [Wenyingzhuangia sp. 2_MG-2023]|uniref:hypothetical protein n=1 Tax=Wenyingzhuangia sp. 2_MG-2023 TaxID=3062639 RepID=UPI0026E331FC|nr:hypothetical protein [Wenyingzhuangia sp. 2_MG-2023]MDO6736701.1 hypothetical protein [Wenyingzhuangia sp. 2_MG-2023]